MTVAKNAISADRINPKRLQIETFTTAHYSNHLVHILVEDVGPTTNIFPSYIRAA